MQLSKHKYNIIKRFMLVSTSNKGRTRSVLSLLPPAEQKM